MFFDYFCAGSFIFYTNLIDTFQSGFRKNRSTHTALITIVDDLREAIDFDKVALLSVIDFPRASGIIKFDQRGAYPA